MSTETIGLARRAMACTYWRWMPGMRAVDGAERFRVSVVSHGYPSGVDEQPPMKVNVDLGLRWLPDLTDPATLGCLLALVREAWNDSSSFAYNDGKAWAIQSAWRGPFFHSETEAEALIKALEEAP